MPEPSTSERDQEYINDILNFADKIANYVQGFDENAFMADDIRQLAIERLITILGEASSRVSQETKLLMPEVPWRQMSDVRNKLIHDYGRVDLRLVYHIATASIPNAVSILRTSLANRQP